VAVEKILTRHPQGKRGKNLEKGKYDAVASALREALSKGDLTHTELMGRVVELLPKFEGHVSWYAETVKLDMEARGAIERTTSKPPRYRLKT
jgi:hypothetical protein